MPAGWAMAGRALASGLSAEIAGFEIEMGVEFGNSVLVASVSAGVEGGHW